MEGRLQNRTGCSGLAPPRRGELSKARRREGRESSGGLGAEGAEVLREVRLHDHSQRDSGQAVPKAGRTAEEKTGLHEPLQGLWAFPLSEMQRHCRGLSPKKA